MRLAIKLNRQKHLSVSIVPNLRCDFLSDSSSLQKTLESELSQPTKDSIEKIANKT